MPTSAFILSFIISSSFILNHVSCTETDTLKPGQLLRDWEQLVSSGKVFRLGFFNPNPNTVDLGPPGPRYLGIWFNNIPFYSVWVANRENPVPDSSGALSIGPDGKLKIKHQGSTSPIIINPNQPSQLSNKTTSSLFALTLLDSGNLVIRRTDSNGIPVPGFVLWQSFDYPHNMLLPGMKLGANLKTGKTWELTSWLSDKVPSPGAFKLTLDPSGIDQLLVWRRGKIYWSTGQFQNGSFQNATSLTGFTKDSGIHEFKFVNNSDERYFTYSIRNGPALSRMDLDTLGEITLFTLDQRTETKHWIFDTAGSPCPAGVGNVGVCLAEEGGSGCRNETEVFVGKRGFMIGEERFEGGSLSLSDCHGECWRNCSCVAYQAASYDETGCRFWSLGSNFTAYDFIGLEGVADVVYILKSLAE
ncbi:G-type lectin S-receptor-like serine/threonine-protein kinase CES101 [Linum perenne]